MTLVLLDVSRGAWRRMVSVCAVVVVLAAGCARTTGPAGAEMTMTDAVKAGRLPVAPRQGGSGSAAVDAPYGGAAPVVIATVNGQEITYRAWIDLLKKSQGLRAFQYMLGVELARQAAQAKGITLSDDQLNHAMKQEVARVTGSDQDPAQQQRTLAAVLLRRGITMEEFRLLGYRNAYLRRIVEPIVERSITDDALEAEFDRLYGVKVQIRHIQVSDGNQVAGVQKALHDGMDFAEVARQFSQNIETAAEGGLLPPFSRSDPAAPVGLRQLAFATEVGQVAGPVQIDGWSHIIKVQQRMAAEPVEYAAVVGQVRQSLKEQMIMQEMQKLLQNLLQSAVIRIPDSDLNQQFEALRSGSREGGTIYNHEPRL